jgi:putative redox protein
MKAVTTWKEKMLFSGETGGNTIAMDAKAPIGTGTAVTPKELLGFAVSGCTAMDVVSLLRKYREPLEALSVDVDAPIREGSQPAVFSEMNLVFKIQGALNPEKVLEAVRLSQTKYCGVSAMLAKAFPIRYKVILNGQEIGSGMADF